MALIPPFFLNSVVAIGTKNSYNEVFWIGTGFLIGKKVINPDKTVGYVPYLVTNKHVLLGLNIIVVKFDSNDSDQTKQFELSALDKMQKPIWTCHPSKEHDIAVILLNADFLTTQNLDFNLFQSDNHLFSLVDMKEKGISEGDYIYVLGFPLGLVDSGKQHVIVRQGAIARIRDLFSGNNSSYIIDAAVYPGNSGGPVISKPEMIYIEGTKSNSSSKLIGMVKSYIPFQETAISQQTQLPRITFQENSGLALVETVDSILETIEESERVQN